MYKLSLASPSFLHKYNESRRIDFFLGFTERRKREITKAPLCIERERELGFNDIQASHYIFQ
jgi:hypothetical protein